MEGKHLLARVISLSLFFGLFFGLNYPEVVRRRDYLRLPCVLAEKAVIPSYACETECSGCYTAPADAPVCSALEERGNSLDPRQCMAGRDAQSSVPVGMGTTAVRNAVRCARAALLHAQARHRLAPRRAPLTFVIATAAETLTTVSAPSRARFTTRRTPDTHIYHRRMCRKCSAIRSSFPLVLTSMQLIGGWRKTRSTELRYVMSTRMMCLKHGWTLTTLPGSGL